MQDELRVLADEIRACTACPLHRSARQAVPGEGSAESGIFFLGEAPGYNEDLQGRPFIGAAGQLLDELLSDIGLDRSKVFITNVVRHRPPRGRGRFVLVHVAIRRSAGVDCQQSAIRVREATQHTDRR